VSADDSDNVEIDLTADYDEPEDESAAWDAFLDDQRRDEFREPTHPPHDPAPAVPAQLPRPRIGYGAVEVLDETGQWVDPAHVAAVAYEVERMHVRDEARRAYQAESIPPEPFDAGTLAEVMARAPVPEARVEDFLPWEAGLLWTAQRKAGKTTGALNLARSLLTGEPFLGSKAVRAIDAESKVGFLNFEVSALTFGRWARAHAVPEDRLFIVTLRGRPNPFKNDAELARLGALLREARVESLIVDPFGKAFDGTDQNDNTQVQAWFDRLDGWARGLVGALDVIVTAHAGKNGEGFRGASSAEGWPDSIVTMTKQGQTRFIAVEGRDVDLDETALAFDPATKQLTLAGGSRADTTQNDGLDRIVRLLNDAAVPMSGRAIEDALDGMVGRDEVRAALKFGQRMTRLTWEYGPKRAHLWSVVVMPEFVNGDSGDDND